MPSPTRQLVKSTGSRSRRTPLRRLTTLTALTAATCALTLGLAGCGGDDKDESPTAGPSTSSDSSADASDTSAAEQTPQERIEGYFAAADKSAAEGWTDTSYNAEYLVPDLAKKADEREMENSKTGAIITGERKMTDWTTVEETDTAATIEFCEDGTDMEATKDGEPYEIRNEPGISVAQYKLTRDSESDPWLISQRDYYPEGTTCDEHFKD